MGKIFNRSIALSMLSVKYNADGNNLSDEQLQILQIPVIKGLIERGLLLNLQERANLPKPDSVGREYSEDMRLDAWKKQRSIESIKRAITLDEAQIARITKLFPYIDTGLIDLDRAINPTHEKYISDENVEHLADQTIRNLFGLMVMDQYEPIAPFINGVKPIAGAPPVTQLSRYDFNYNLELESFLAMSEEIKNKLKNPVRAELLKSLTISKDKQVCFDKALELTDKQLDRLENERVRDDVYNSERYLHPQPLTLEELETMTDREFAIYTNAQVREWAMGNSELRGDGERFENAPRPKLLDLAKTLTDKQVEALRDIRELKMYIFTGRMTIDAARNCTLEQISILGTLADAINHGVCTLSEATILREEPAKVLGELYELITDKKITKEEAVTLDVAQAKFLRDFAFLTDSTSLNWNGIIAGANTENDYYKLIGGNIFSSEFKDAFSDLVNNKRGFFDKFKQLSAEQLQDFDKKLESALAAVPNLEKRVGYNDDLRDRNRQLFDKLVGEVKSEKTAAAKKAILDTVYPELARLGAPHSETGTRNLG